MFVSFSKEESKELLMIRGYSPDDAALDAIINASEVPGAGANEES